MSLLFYVNLDSRVALHPEVIKLCPGFNGLNDNEITFVVTYADYNSPYKQFPELERKRKAMWHAFQENEYDLIESPRILMAVKDYISLQYNPKIETARIFQEKINQYEQQLLTTDTPALTKKIGEAIDDLNKRIAALHKDYDTEMEKQGVIKGKMQLSYLEKLMSNQKHYQSVVAKSKK